MDNSSVDWHIISGLSDYNFVITKMDDIVQDIINFHSRDIIILTEHKDVITAGISSKPEDIIISESSVPIIQTSRGGKYTYHGKGQRVIYPIINLSNQPWNRDLKKYINFLHNWIISTLKFFSIESYRRPDHVGIWTKDKGLDAKIAAVGVRVKKWVAYHGVAVNINTDLNMYDGFIPCGIRDLGVTSLKKLGLEISLEEFDEILKKSYYTELENFRLYK